MDAILIMVNKNINLFYRMTLPHKELFDFSLNDKKIIESLNI